MTPSTVFQAIGAAPGYAFLQACLLIVFGRLAWNFAKTSRAESKARHEAERRYQAKRDEAERQYVIAYRRAQCRRRIQFDTVSRATLDELLGRIVEAES